MATAVSFVFADVELHSLPVTHTEPTRGEEIPLRGFVTIPENLHEIGWHPVIVAEEQHVLRCRGKPANVSFHQRVECVTEHGFYYEVTPWGVQAGKVGNYYELIRSSRETALHDTRETRFFSVVGRYNYDTQGQAARSSSLDPVVIGCQGFISIRT
jgi:hypothetical protein